MDEFRCSNTSEINFEFPRQSEYPRQQLQLCDLIVKNSPNYFKTSPY